MKVINYEQLKADISSLSNFYDQVDKADRIFELFCPDNNVARVDIYNNVSGDYLFYRTVYSIEGRYNTEQPLIIEDKITEIESTLEKDYNEIKIVNQFRKDLGDFIFKVYPITTFSFEEENDIIINICHMHEIYKLVLNVLEKQDPRTKMPTISGLRKVSYLNTILTNVNYNNNKLNRSLICFNIKDLGKINTICGSMERGNIVFDEIIKKISNLIKDKTQQETYMFRNSDGNFLVLVDSQYVEEICDSIKSFPLEVKFYDSTIDFDIVCYGAIYDINKYKYNTNTIDNLGTALRLFKEDNQNGFVDYGIYDEELNIRTYVRNEFDEAIEEERIIPYFQPKVDSKTNKLCGAEILCRWLKKDGKMIFPGVFIPVLEKTNKIEKLDFYMLRQCCKAIKYCVDNEIDPVPISVNFSRNHFVNFDEYECVLLSNKIIDIIREYDIDPSLIQVELTESGKLQNPMLINKFIEKLKKSGIKVLMDDFGTENSTILDLINLSFDVVKIDKSFLKDLLNPDFEISNSKRKAIHDTVNMIKNQGRTVLFEGVEDAEELDFLRTIGCNIIQGYFYDKPLPFYEFKNRLQTPYYGTLNNIDDNLIYSLSPFDLMQTSLKGFKIRMFIKDINGKYLFISDNAMVKSDGKENNLDCREVSARTDDEIKRPESSAAVSMYYDKKVIEEEKEVNYIVNEGGRFLEILKKPLMYGQKIIGIFGTIYDVTERELEREKLEIKAYQDGISKCFEKEYIDVWYKRNKNSDIYPISIITTDCIDSNSMQGIYDSYIVSGIQTILNSDAFNVYLGDGRIITIIPNCNEEQSLEYINGIKNLIKESTTNNCIIENDSKIIYEISDSNELLEFVTQNSKNKPKILNRKK